MWRQGAAAFLPADAEGLVWLVGGVSLRWWAACTDLVLVRGGDWAAASGWEIRPGSLHGTPASYGRVSKRRSGGKVVPAKVLLWPWLTTSAHEYWRWWVEQG